MACEQTNTNLGTRKAVITVIEHLDRCATCGKTCCNCAMCVQHKNGERDICEKCRRAAATKKGAA